MILDRIDINYNNALTYYHEEVQPAKWYLICLRKQDEQMDIILNAKVIGSLKAYEEFWMNGTLVIGQDQDIRGSFFGISQSWMGRITQLNLWDFALSNSQVTF